MDEERRQAYLNLIQQLLTCSSGEEFQIFESNRELVDAELLQVMAQEAEKLAADGNQNAADVLLRFRSELLERISESSTLVNPSSEDYWQFLTEVLIATINSNSDPKVVYPLLEANLEKLDDNFIDILKTWASAKLSELEPERAEIIGIYIGEFSNLINNFNLDNKANNMEIAIAGYETIITVLTLENNPIIWANIQNNLGIAYSDRINGDKADNLELAIEAYQLALEVRTKQDFPEDWAMTQYNLGNAYSKRILGNSAKNLEKAIASYQNSSEFYTRDAYPKDWADIQRNIGKLLVQQGSWYDGLSRLEQSLPIYRHTENLEALADSVYHIARTHHLIMNLDKARMNYRDALRIYNHLNNQPGIAICKTGLGILMISIGFIDDARQELTQAYEICHTIKDNQGIDNIQQLLQVINKIKAKP
ncbi:tetratricopeptide repeat protein [Moorena sp. SIO4G3]|uniref:tetratricopeptide repeat protein n=1 Tax=Moorena sp. SIO4G3 TaxID=2607821 RepID=UPI00142A47E3|nr:tetratricopeptide repeat protein [Moorena sp. SIO4G3]NEO76523.1 tetratricopeptide repeat protein [Moorena sp. SIO4G3]